MMEPKISVIVPIYQVEAYVERCLTSLAAQTWPHMEVIIIDDGSPDGRGRICDGWAARDERFQVVHLPENRGLSAARNEGVSRASGAYIVFVDSDDYVEPELLKTLYRALAEGRGDISVCGGEGLGLRAGPAFKNLQGQGLGWCCLFTANIAFCPLFPLKFSCITYLTSYH